MHRLLAIGALAVVTAACSQGTASPPTTSTPTTVTTSTLVTLGKVCGVTAMSGGFAVGVQDPALLRECPSGPHQVTHIFTIMASSGKTYTADAYDNSSGWSAVLPVGTYRAVNVYGCRNHRAQAPFAIVAGKTLKGVVIRYGCDFT